MRVWLKKRKRKHGEYWALRWRAGGHMHYESLGRVSLVTKAEAKDARRAKEAELRHGAVATYAGKRLRLSQLVEARDQSRDRPSDGMAHVVGLATQAVGDLYADALTPQHAVAIRAALRERRVPQTGEPISDATFIKYLRSLRTLWNWAKRQGYVAGDNPFTAEKIGSPRPKEPRILTPDEQAAMETVIQRRTMRQQRGPWAWWLTFLRLALATGLRRNELLYLRWRDVDLDGDQPLARVRDHDGPLPFRVKARHSTRSVPIDPAIVAMLRDHRREWSGDYVFLTPSRVRDLAQRDELPSCPVLNLRRQIRSIQKEANIDEPWAGLHDLRKTCLTRWAAREPMHVVRQLAGHSSITTTAEHYLAVGADDMDRIRKATVQGRKVKSA